MPWLSVIDWFWFCGSCVAGPEGGEVFRGLLFGFLIDLRYADLRVVISLECFTGRIRARLDHLGTIIVTRFAIERIHRFLFFGWVFIGLGRHFISPLQTY
jgi:hypothetical protein